MTQQDIEKLSDDDLLDHIREQVNLSRFNGKHDRTKTRMFAEEGAKRGWALANRNIPQSHQYYDPHA